jgi:hypothetical protein
VEVQNGNRIGLDDVRIDFHKVVPARQAFSEASEADRHNGVMDGLFEGLTATVSVPVESHSAATLARPAIVSGGDRLAFPGISEGHPVTKHLASQGTIVKVGAVTAETEWSPKFLDQHQGETRAVLSECIVPASSKAHVSHFIDLLLSVDTRDAQTKFLASLSAFEADALSRFPHPSRDFDETNQNEIPTSASTANQGDAKESQTLRVTMPDHFENIKNRVAGAYHSWKSAWRNWDGQARNFSQLSRDARNLGTTTPEYSGPTSKFIVRSLRVAGRRKRLGSSYEEGRSGWTPTAAHLRGTQASLS